MTTKDYTALPPGRAIKLAPDRDELIKRGLIIVIGLYLIISLAAPLYVMLSKSFSTYRFDLNSFEIQQSDESGTVWTDPQTAFALNESSGAFSSGDMAAKSDTRLAATALFPDFNFRSTVQYRIRGTTSDATYLVGQQPYRGTDWLELDSANFRRVMLRPESSIGFSNYKSYFSTPSLRQSISNSFSIALISTVITVTAAFGFAYALSRSMMRFKAAFRLIALIPILVPSLLPGMALVYLFGNQGLLKGLLMGGTIYGPLGIVIGSVFFTFPHAFIILSTALAIADQRYYEAADSLRASKWRTFWTVTIPGARYGLISAAFVVFTLVITDFGLPKVIGGRFNVLAVDIYKQVIGQQNFEMGAVVSVVLLIPALAAFVVDRIVQKKQVSLLSARSVPYEPKPNRTFDRLCLLWCTVIAVFIVGIIAICQLAAMVKFWPYDMTPSLRNFAFHRMDGGGWAAYQNSLKLALMTAVIGTVIVFIGAYAVEKIDGFRTGRTLFHFLAMLPMAVPGMVLGLSYVFFFNNPSNPLNPIYGTMAILVLSVITHFYTVGHLTALTALKQIDREFEPVASSLKTPVYKLFGMVTVPICLPAVLDISIYLFVNAMTTVSAVVFLYSSGTALAAVAVLNMDDAGDIAPAAAMGMLIFYTNIGARLLHMLLSRKLNRKTQAWRKR